MSSGRRSSTNSNLNNSANNSLRSPKPPTWRTVSVVSNKNSPSATLSYVFAEPELAKAKAKEIHTMNGNEEKNAGTTTSSSSSGSSSQTDLGAELSTSSSSSKTSLVALKGPSIDSSQAASPTQHAPSTNTVHRTAQTFPSQINTTNASEPSFVPFPSLPSSSSSNIQVSRPQTPTPKGAALNPATSWFGSLSRQKGKQSAMAVTDGHVSANVLQVKDSSERLRSKLAGVLDLRDVPDGSTPEKALSVEPPQPEIQVEPQAGSTLTSSPTQISSFASPEPIPNQPPTTPLPEEPQTPPLLPVPAPASPIVPTPSPKRYWFSPTPSPSQSISPARLPTTITTATTTRNPVAPLPAPHPVSPPNNSSISSTSESAPASRSSSSSSSDTITGNTAGPNVVAANAAPIAPATIADPPSPTRPSDVSAAGSVRGNPQEPRARLSSLNPSTSRFKLSIPLLLGLGAGAGASGKKQEIGGSTQDQNTTTSTTMITTKAAVINPSPSGTKDSKVEVGGSGKDAPVTTSTTTVPAKATPISTPPSDKTASTSTSTTTTITITTPTPPLSSPTAHPPDSNNPAFNNSNNSNNANLQPDANASARTNPQPTPTLPKSKSDSDSDSHPSAPAPAPIPTPTSTWWEYVGWGSSSSSITPTPALPLSQTSETKPGPGPGEGARPGNEDRGGDTDGTGSRSGAGAEAGAVTGPSTGAVSSQAQVIPLDVTTRSGNGNGNGNGASPRGDRIRDQGPSSASSAYLLSTTARGVPVPTVGPVPAVIVSGDGDADGEEGKRGGGKGDEEARRGEDEDEDRDLGGAGAWYSPWSWYAGGTTTTTTTTTATMTGGGAGEGEEKEQAPNEQPIPPPEVLVPPTPVEEVPANPLPLSTFTTNPVSSTFSTSSTSWASFFSSGAFGVKRITSSGEGGEGGVKRDEHGAEVMDVDVDEIDEAGAGGPPVHGEKRKDSMNGSDSDTAPPPSKKQNNGQPQIRGRNDSTKSAVGASGTKAAPPLIISDSVKRQTGSAPNTPINKKRSASPAASTKSTTKPSAGGSGRSTPVQALLPKPPNMVLPNWQETFHTAPRGVVPPVPETAFSRAMGFVSGVLFGEEGDGAKGKEKGKGKAKWRQGRQEREEKEWLHFGKELPRAWDVTEGRAGVAAKDKGKGVCVGVPTIDPDVLRGCKRVVVIGIHGWFPGAVMRTMIGEPTGTSTKFVNMMVQALEDFQAEHAVTFDKITKIPLEGEGTIEGRVLKLYANLQTNQQWMEDLHHADAILIATHSQGSVVSTHLLDRLIRDNHIRTLENCPPSQIQGGPIAQASPMSVGLGGDTSAEAHLKPHRICCLALCGIHLGPLRYLKSSSLVKPYIQYFESTAAKELFEFQNTESDVSKSYVEALRRVVGQGAKMVYVASLNDQVVPIYSGLFTAASHPLILRALYIDGDAYHSSDFLSNLFVLLLRILNSGISDSGLLVHLSESTAGSLNGVGHSTAYEEVATYSLAVKYLFLANDGLKEHHPDLVVEPFNALSEQNDYEIPWSLRDIIGDERVAYFFTREIAELRDAFREWHPKTSILRDLKRKLQPIQRLPTSFTSIAPSSSKL